MSSDFLSSGDAYAAAYGTLTGVVQQYLKGNSTEDELRDAHAVAAGIVDSYYTEHDPELSGAVLDD